MCSQLRNGRYRLIIERYTEPRTLSQNALMWLWFTCIEQETGTDKQDVHDYYCNLYLRRTTIIKGKELQWYRRVFLHRRHAGDCSEGCFADINIYDDDIRLLQQRFVSPIGNNAISFYKYYLMDTLMVDKRECVHLTFVPQNSQDFGFTGHLYVLKDSTYAVQKCTMNLPKKTGVNFVNRMDIVQQYEQLPNGNWVLADDDMTVDLSWNSNKQQADCRWNELRNIVIINSILSNNDCSD